MRVRQKGLGFHLMVENLLGKTMDYRMTGIPRTMQDEEDPQFIIKGNHIDYMYISKEEEFSNGEKIVTEGSYGNWIWVVLEGMVEVTKNTSNGPIIIARLGEGCFIGTLISLFYGEVRRSATVTAVGDVHLGILDQERLSSDFSCSSKDFRDLLESYTSRLFKITNRVVNLPQEKQEISQLIKGKKPFMGKRTVMNQVFRIMEGEASVVRESTKGFFPLLKLDKKDFFGPVPFMDINQEFYNAQIFASNDLKILEVDLVILHQEYDKMPVTLKNLIYDAGNCIYKTTNMISTLHLF